ncbi:MAG: DUF4026 domain-containing protein, partial [Oscillospiraceae bacterium]|nr:DUF4026 domain-containing protein [Oscillospiraceae bacterium]
MKSGIIKKTTSYIMGIPMNEADIDTPVLVYDRIKASDEFELKNISFDDKNICPMITVGYKDTEFVVDLKIEPVTAVSPDFMFSHPVPDECMKQIKQAKIGLTVSLTFNDDILASHHFQLKLLNCIIPDIAAVVDFNVRRIFSPVWLKQVAASAVSPGPAYIYSINIAADRENSSEGAGRAWIFTQGLNRCGFMELEVINAEEKNIDFYATSISIAANKAISERTFPGEMEPFDVASLEEGKKLTVSWRYWKGEMEVFPDGVLGKGSRRPKEQNLFNGILFIAPNDGSEKKLVRANEVKPFSLEKAVIEYSPEESQRIAELAKETLPHFVKGFTVPGAKGIVKIRMAAGEKSEKDIEYVWAEVDSIDGETVYCTA